MASSSQEENKPMDVDRFPRGLPSSYADLGLHLENWRLVWVSYGVKGVKGLR